MPKHIPIDTLIGEKEKTVRNTLTSIETTNMEIKNMDKKSSGRYAVRAQYDFVNIIEASNNDAISGLSLGPAESMGITRIITFPAIPVDDFAVKMTQQHDVVSHLISLQ